MGLSSEISVLLLLFLTGLLISMVDSTTPGCRLINEEDGKDVPDDDHKGYNKLKPLVGKRFSTIDVEKEYRYSVGICRDAVDGYKNVGVLQESLKDKRRHVIGLYNSTQIMSGNDWVMIEYWHGEKYHTHCNKEEKKAVIIIICDPSADDENGVDILDEAKAKIGDCYYLFEISHKAVCGIKSSSKALSFGSIVLIIFASVVALYLFLGFLYQRFVLHAKGMEQIPNYSFWQDFGNLEADGCNLVCRSMSNRNSAPYKGIGDEQLEEDLDRDRDDHLLPM
ncbi:cation-dependent mannose-6-phosphate receptor [Patella vulgata]|uniref:cation-dependent mannose-6-phosphate receptor n=1 Tax=Patella vulgata TaxID=6465 RepID=UPI00217F3874|nr:cation-dependent mannose-6-phosphate receptor [Patella vulgata]